MASVISYKGMKQEDEVLHHADAHGAAIFFAGMFIFAAVMAIREATTTPSGWIFTGLIALGSLSLAVVSHGHSETVYTDRLEFTSTWRREPEVIPFSSIDRVVLRSEHNGLRLEIHAGKRKLRWESKQSGYMAEAVIKCIHDALIAAGVEIDSLNRMRNGPFTAWLHTEQPDK
jgi:hypothetical protein